MAELTPGAARELVGAAFEVTSAKSPVVKGAAEAHRAGDYETSLKVLAGDAVPFTAKDIDAGLTDRFGSRIESGPKAGHKEPAKSGVDAKRTTDSKSVAERGRKYIEGDKASVDAVVPEIQSFILNNSELLRDVIDQAVAESAAAGGTPLSKEAVAKKMAQQIAGSDRYRELFREQYVNRLDPSRKIEGEAEVRRLKTELAKMEGELVGSFDKKELMQAQADHADQMKVWAAQTDADKYFDNYKVVNRLGASYDSDTDIVNEYAASSTAIVEEIGKLESLREAPHTGGARAPRAFGDAEAKRLAELQDKRGIANAAQGRINAVNAAKTQMTTLETDNPSLKVEREKAEQLAERVQTLATKARSGGEEITSARRIELEAEIAEARIQLADAEYAYDSAKAQAARDIVRMPQDAAGTYMQEVFEDLKSKWATEAENSKSAEEETFNFAKDKLTHAWKTKEASGKKSKIKVWKTDKMKAEGVVSSYLEGGASALGGEWMRRGLVNIGPGGKLRMAPDADLATKFGLTPAEAASLRSKFGADPTSGEFTKDQFDAFFASNSEQFVSMAVSDYLGAGGKLNKNILRAFTETAAGTSMIENAIAHSSDAKERINALAGRDVIGGEGIKAWFAEHGKTKNGLKVLAMIALLLAGAVGAPLLGGLGGGSPR